MATANIYQAKTNLSTLPNAAAADDDVIITCRGGAITQLRLLLLEPRKKPRLFGALKGKIVFPPDYDTADQEILELLERSVRQ